MLSRGAPNCKRKQTVVSCFFAVFLFVFVSGKLVGRTWQYDEFYQMDDRAELYLETEPNSGSSVPKVGQLGWEPVVAVANDNSWFE